MERSRASSSSCPPGLRRPLFSFFPVVSFMLHSRSGGGLDRWPFVRELHTCVPVGLVRAGTRGAYA